MCIEFKTYRREGGVKLVIYIVIIGRIIKIVFKGHKIELILIPIGILYRLPLLLILFLFFIFKLLKIFKSN